MKTLDLGGTIGGDRAGRIGESGGRGEGEGGKRRGRSGGGNIYELSTP